MVFPRSPNSSLARLNDALASSSKEDHHHYSQLLRDCCRSKCLHDGQRLHAEIRAKNLDTGTILGNFLVKMYASTGSIALASAAFDHIRQKNLHSWSFLVSANAHSGHIVDAASIFHKMALHSVYSTTVMILGYCQNSQLVDARSLFDDMPSRDSVCWNAIITAYAQAGHVSYAIEVFYKTPLLDRISWNSLMSAYCRAGKTSQVKNIFDEMPDKDVVSWNVAVAVYAMSGDIRSAKLLFERMACEDLFSRNTMINAYAQNGHYQDAAKLFESMEGKNTVTWNTMIRAFTQSGDLERARGYFHRMPSGRDLVSWTLLLQTFPGSEESDGRSVKDAFWKMPSHDSVCWTVMLAAYAQNEHQAGDAKMVFDRMPRRDVVCWTSLITVCARAELFDLARAVLERMPGCDALSWAALAYGFAQKGLLEESRDVLEAMPELDLVVYTVVMQAHSLRGEIEQTKRMFDSLPVRSAVVWNMMATCFVHNGCQREAVEVFKLMDLDGFLPDESSFSTALNACGSLSLLAEGKRIHVEAVETGLGCNTVVASALLSMYSECGALPTARSVFDTMPRPNEVTWNSMIGAYAANGHGREALELFQAMKLEGVDVTSITFVNVLSACSHTASAAAASEAWFFFLSMQQDFGIAPKKDHFVCVVDALCRRGKLREAEELINTMPFEPDDIAWMTLLGACRRNASAECGQRAAERLVEMSPEFRAAACVMLSNTNVEAANSDDVLASCC
ncbi:pentatricopeptide repeat-containing protein At4g02750 [Selaginella moellendorffii]|uniref:pentatricopeptide repeat-containing protein At4g02750 n=1 Tax=Selaginella moellendorffii TaxID=88036 RepID=UPI000D1C7B84|nr:pentatricopeptide repeat-containing protein At4g02750 [Selaginella moellendorffii]|eukprot:XP_024518940.1 pentatricopeptide repeat-containing protein At4g02750 [Selaginella moellendorffii]